MTSSHDVTQSQNPLPHSDFAALALAHPLLQALVEAKFTTPTPIQAEAIPAVMAGHDLLGIAQTGTGKTAAFGLPVLHHLFTHRQRPAAHHARALILAPTRELAVQIGDSFRVMAKHVPLRMAVVFGGVGHQPQIRAMSKGVDVLIATPGRLLDLMDQGYVRLDRLSHVVLDEADRMLDMGFVRDVRRIIASAPIKRQSMLFSATMPPDIARLAAEFLHDPVRVEVTPQSVPVDRIEQQLYYVDASGKRPLLLSLLQNPEMKRVIVFTRTKHGANRVAEILEQSGVSSDAIHGNKSQNARQRALDEFRAGRIRVLVATDIAARGIDIPAVSHVINFELPVEAESYVHRIGRTARAGNSGIAISFCDGSERSLLRTIERITGRKLDVAGGTPPVEEAPPSRGRGPRRGPGGNAGPGGGNRKPQGQHGAAGKPSQGNRSHRPYNDQGGSDRPRRQDRAA